MYKKYVKRFLDIIISIIALPFISVVILILAPFIYKEDKGTIFYKADRRGKDGKIFKIYKLRSMKMDAPDIRNSDNSTFNSSNDPRVTRVGRVIRKFSIDELPQVFNVFKGDMSWIGPRPVTIDKPLEEYDDKRWIRLQVRPGITGYTQAYYRNSISQEEKFEMDADYAENVSFVFDFKILCKTVQTVLLRRGLYKNPDGNMK